MKARTTARHRSALIAVPAALFAMAAPAAVAQEATPAPATIGVLEPAPELAQCEVPELGETRAMAGAILLGEDGLPVPCSRFDIDLRTLQSDSARRDNYLYQNTLQTESFPLATFVLRGAEGLDGPLVEGEETTFTLLGDLTLKDQTRLVAWETTATLEGETLTGTAVTEFEMPEFAIEPPRVQIVVSLDETVRLEIDLSARRAS